MSQPEQIPGTLETFTLTGGVWERLPQPMFVRLPSGHYLSLANMAATGPLKEGTLYVYFASGTYSGLAFSGDDALALDAYLRSVALALPVPGKEHS